MSVRQPVVKERLNATRRVTPNQRASTDQQGAEYGSNRTGQRLCRNERRRKKADGRTDSRSPGLLAGYPTSPGGKSGDKHRGNQSSHNAADEDTPVTEGMAYHRASCSAYSAEQTTSDEQFNGFEAHDTR